MRSDRDRLLVVSKEVDDQRATGASGGAGTHESATWTAVVAPVPSECSCSSERFRPGRVRQPCQTPVSDKSRRRFHLFLFNHTILHSSADKQDKGIKINLKKKSSDRGSLEGTASFCDGTAMTFVLGLKTELSLSLCSLFNNGLLMCVQDFPKVRLTWPLQTLRKDIIDHIFHGFKTSLCKGQSELQTMLRRLDDSSCM